MEEIEKRLRDATEACLASHAEWAKNRKEGATREKLMEAVHELRKVAARLEIEMAISERDEMAAKPLPIPPHRASNKRRHTGDMNDYGGGNGNGGEEESAGNAAPSGGMSEEGIARTMRRRRPGGPGPGPGQGPIGGGNNNGNIGGGRPE